MEICIIGGSGFIGSCLTGRLAQNPTSHVVIVDKVMSRAYPALCRIADVRSIETLSAAIPSNALLINLAAEHRDDVTPRTLYHDVNVQGASNVCTVAREKNVSTIVFTSSVAVYGFAPVGTDECGEINPFNEYGRTKYLAEQIFRAWQSEAPTVRTLIIVRPTVVFGEKNRGNVYNLLRQIASGRFVMIGDGLNRKSIAYVENLAAFIVYASRFNPGTHTYNYIDKPDFTMNLLVTTVNKILGKRAEIRIRLPFAVGYAIGAIVDAIAMISRKKLPISSIRVKKFCANSVYNTAIDRTKFVAPVELMEALQRTVRYEFVERADQNDVFFSE